MIQLLALLASMVAGILAMFTIRCLVIEVKHNIKKNKLKSRLQTAVLQHSCSTRVSAKAVARSRLSDTLCDDRVNTRTFDRYRFLSDLIKKNKMRELIYRVPIKMIIQLKRVLKIINSAVRKAIAISYELGKGFINNDK